MNTKQEFILNTLADEELYYIANFQRCDSVNHFCFQDDEIKELVNFWHSQGSPISYKIINLQLNRFKYGNIFDDIEDLKAYKKNMMRFNIDYSKKITTICGQNVNLYGKIKRKDFILYEFFKPRDFSMLIERYKNKYLRNDICTKCSKLMGLEI